MKYAVTHFKSLKVALKELEPFIRNGQHLETGRGFAQFGDMRSREMLANWLLCVAVNSTTTPGRLTFTSDPDGGDGIIYDTETKVGVPTEHVMVPQVLGSAAAIAETLILDKVKQKVSKAGAAYAAGKTLVVFMHASAGEWYPNKVAKQLPVPLRFDAVWVVGLQGVEKGEYVYNITRLDLTQGNCPAWRVRIAKDFEAWHVAPVQ